MIWSESDSDVYIERVFIIGCFMQQKIFGNYWRRRTIPETATTPNCSLQHWYVHCFQVLSPICETIKTCRVVQHFQSTNLDHILKMKQPHFQAFHKLSLVTNLCRKACTHNQILDCADLRSPRVVVVQREGTVNEKP